MEGVANFLENLLRNPPAWGLAIIGAILVAHALHIVMRVMIKHDGTPGLLIGFLELILVIVVAYVSLEKSVTLHFPHQAASGLHAADESQRISDSATAVTRFAEEHWFDHPLVYLLIFIACVHSSVWMYIQVRKTESSLGNGNRKLNN